MSDSTTTDPPPSRWAHIRAAFVAFHILAIVILSFPSSYKLADRPRWDRPRTQREFQLWADRLTGWGYAITRPELDAKLWASAQRYLQIRRAIATPFEPYQQLGCVIQTWGMFKSPQRRPAQLRVEVREAGQWRTVYLSRSDQHRYLVEQFDQHRVRKLVARTTGNAALFKQLAAWIHSRAQHDFPKASELRVTLERFRSLTAEDRQAGKKPRVSATRVKRYRLATSQPKKRPAKGGPP